jgi:hypothetical protein
LFHNNAESALGSGTTFTLYLPRSTSQAAPSRSPERDGDNSAFPTRRILLVEDNEPSGFDPAGSMGKGMTIRVSAEPLRLRA